MGSQVTRPIVGGVLLLVLSGVPRLAEAPRDALSPRVSGPLFPPARAWMLDAASRDRWQRPAALVRALALRPGDRVADVGSGSGYMLPHLARTVGPKGRVYAQEIQPAMLRLLAARARNHSNVRVCRGTADDPGLPARTFDRALLLTVYHEVSAPVALLSRLRAAMRPGGRLLIVDWNDFATGAGTPAISPGERAPESVVCAEAVRAGWRLTRRHTFLPYQYCLEFALAKAARGGE